MAKQNPKRRRSNRLSWQFLDKLKRQTLIESTASSLRLSGINITNREVARIVSQSVARSAVKRDVEKSLSPKQLAVWEYIQKVHEAAPGEIAKVADIARPTVSQAIARLMQLKKIGRIGQGRATRYQKL